MNSKKLKWQQLTSRLSLFPLIFIAPLAMEANPKEENNYAAFMRK